MNKVNIPITYKIGEMGTEQKIWIEAISSKQALDILKKSLNQEGIDASKIMVRSMPNFISNEITVKEFETFLNSHHLTIGDFAELSKLTYPTLKRFRQGKKVSKTTYSRIENVIRK